MSLSDHSSDWIDGSLYPDQPVPTSLDSLADRGDFIVRLCAAWDFGVMPRPSTLRVILHPDWRDAVDEAQLLTSCAWHVLRDLHDLPRARYLGPRFPHIENDAWLAQV